MTGRIAGLAAVAALAALLLGAPGSAAAAPAPVRAAAAPVRADAAVLLAAPAVRSPDGPSTPKGPTGTVNLKLGGATKPSQSVTIILLLTILSVAPALLVLTTSFTKMVVVLSLTRNALGLQGVPPNQVLAGLALFLSLFVMAPTFAKVNHDGVQPYLSGKATSTAAYRAGSAPLKSFMLKQTRPAELELLIKASKEKRPARPADVSMSTLVPAFVLSELRSAFIIGFVIFIPFLIIDLVVSSSLMSMGMMMMPPVLVSLPFKLLLFVMVDGWGLVVTSLVRSYR